jgi:hypothetical protein
MAAWLHQLTATALGEDIVHGHGCCRTLKMSVAASLPVSVCMM